MRSHIITLMVEKISETSNFINLLTRLSARENFIEFCRRKNFKTNLMFLSVKDKLVTMLGKGS